jgi:hypothetical protein
MHTAARPSSTLSLQIWWVRTIMADHITWAATASDLLRAAGDFVGDGTARSGTGWPKKSPRARQPSVSLAYRSALATCQSRIALRANGTALTET